MGPPVQYPPSPPNLAPRAPLAPWATVRQSHRLFNCNRGLPAVFSQHRVVAGIALPNVEKVRGPWWMAGRPSSLGTATAAAEWSPRGSRVGLVVPTAWVATRGGAGPVCGRHEECPIAGRLHSVVQGGTSACSGPGSDRVREPRGECRPGSESHSSVSLSPRPLSFRLCPSTSAHLIRRGYLFPRKLGRGRYFPCLRSVNICETCGALSYAELGTCIKKSGGHYTYILEAFGPLPAFVRLWVELIIIRPAATAVIALTFGQYILQPMFPQCHVPQLAVKIVTALAISLVMFINSSSVSWTARLQTFLTFSKLAAVGIIIIPGIIHLAKGNTEHFQDSFVGKEVGLMGLPLAFYSGMYAYSGWFYMNFVTEEVDNPERNIPLAICISMGIVTVAYTFMNMAYFAVMSGAELLASKAVAVTFAERLLGNFSITVPVFVALSCLGSLNGGVFAIARMFFVASREGHLPHILSMIHVRKHTPLPAVIILYPLTMLMLFVGDIYSLLNFFSFARWLFIAMAVSGLVYMRFTRPHMHRPFKVPLFIPVFFSLSCLLVVALSLYSDPVNSGIGCAITLSGVPVYYLTVVWDGKPTAVKRATDRVTRVLQLILQVAPQEVATY